jgi:HD-like signal output (HDOD) protein
MTTEETIKRIETKINKLPLIDSEVVGIITLLNNPTSNFDKIVEKLSPSLAARFLNIANSAYYGGREVRSINYAVCGATAGLRKNEGYPHNFDINGPFYAAAQRF